MFITSIDGPENNSKQIIYCALILFFLEQISDTKKNAVNIDTNDVIKVKIISELYPLM